MYSGDLAKTWEESPAAVQPSDMEAILDPEKWTIHEVQFGEQAGLVVSPIRLDLIE